MPTVMILNALFLYLVLSGIAGFFGRHRRIGFWGFFFLSILLTPLVTTLLIYFATPRKPQQRPIPRRG